MSKQDPNVGAVRSDPELIADPQVYPGENPQPEPEEEAFDLEEALAELGLSDALLSEPEDA